MKVLKGKVYIDGSFQNGYLGFDKKIKFFKKHYAGKYNNCGNKLIVPGFVDLHTNGGGGISFLNIKKGDIEKYRQFAFSQGITSFFPTLIGTTLNKLETILSEILLSPVDGIHLEGPFISKKKRGVHPVVKEINMQYYRRVARRLPSSVRVLLTAAPELKNIDKLISFAKEKKWILSSGHSDADCACANWAIKSGFKTCTHIFNAMSGIHHRNGGLAQAYLNSDRTIVQLIADGEHVSKETIELIRKVKPNSQIAIVTDNVPPAGLKDGTYKWNGQLIKKEGNCALISGKLAGGLASSSHIASVLKKAGFSKEKIVEMRTAVPAKLALLKKKGQLKEGFDSDILILNDNFSISSVYYKGTWVL